MRAQSSFSLRMRGAKFIHQFVQNVIRHRKQPRDANGKIKIFRAAGAELGNHQVVRMRHDDLDAAHRLGAFAGALLPIGRRLKQSEIYAVRVNGKCSVK